MIRKLLNPDLNYRLGVEDKGDSVLRHKWFKGVDWENLLAKEIPAPWTPILRNDKDSSYFERYPPSQEEPSTLPKDL